MVNAGKQSRILGSKKYGNIQTMGISDTPLSAERGLEWSGAYQYNKRLLFASERVKLALRTQNPWGRGCKLLHQTTLASSYAPVPCRLLHVCDIFENVWPRSFTRPPKGGSATITTLFPSSSDRKSRKTSTASCTDGKSDNSMRSHVYACIDLHKNVCRIFYLSVKEVMIKHVIMTELVPCVELGISERGKRARTSDVILLTSLHMHLHAHTDTRAHRLWLVMGLLKCSQRIQHIPEKNIQRERESTRRDFHSHTVL